MSMRVINDHLWTDAEVEYQLARNRHRQVADNKRNFGPGGPMEGHSPLPSKKDDEDVLELDQDVYDQVISMSVKQVQSFLRKVYIEPTGDERELRMKAAEYLQDQKDRKNKRV